MHENLGEGMSWLFMNRTRDELSLLFFWTQDFGQKKKCEQQKNSIVITTVIQKRELNCCMLV
jgi:hypothetical protein